MIHVVDGVVELGSDGSTGEGRRGRHVGRRRRQGGRRSRWSRLTLGQMNLNKKERNISKMMKKL